MRGIPKTSHCDSDILNYTLTPLSLSVYPSNVPLGHGECWWCSISEKRILLLAPEFSSKLLLTLQQVVFSVQKWTLPGVQQWQHIPTAASWWWLWYMRSSLWENMGILESVQCILREGVLCLDVSDPVFNSLIMSHYTLNKALWHPVSRDGAHFGLLRDSKGISMHC